MTHPRYLFRRALEENVSVPACLYKQSRIGDPAFGANATRHLTGDLYFIAAEYTKVLVNALIVHVKSAMIPLSGYAYEDLAAWSDDNFRGTDQSDWLFSAGSPEEELIRLLRRTRVV